MGAQLSLLTPTASTVALQSYIDIIPNVQYSSTINSSRFLKTVKSLDANGFIIIKVFIKPDRLELPYASILTTLDKQQQVLLNISNTLPFTKVIETERANYVIRPFIKTNLFDRLSTRPFLERYEKNWILFQLLHSLNECHELGIIHGDLKSENILMTSWNWCLLADFENFKPTYLPENSSQFSFYFDTSKRNACYLAPERFDDGKTGDLQIEMDLFSIGCVLAELYLDGSPIFTLSQLFKYKKSEYEPNLNAIDDVNIRLMIQNLIQLNPKKRMSIDHILSTFKGKIFPTDFYEFVYPYFEELSNYKTSSIKNKKDRFQECDYRIDKIYNDFATISKFLKYETPPISQSILSPVVPIPIMFDLPGLHDYSPKTTSNSDLNPMSLIFLSMVLSAVRNTTHSSFRIKSCDLIVVLLEKLHDEAKLDRCLPFLMYLLEDPCCDVKVAALRSITQLLYMCDSISVVNISIWQEYILPKLTLFNNQLNQTKEADFLKAQFATYLPYLMTQSLKFHNFTKILQKDTKAVIKLFDKSNLTKEFENFTINLLTDPNPNVKISLLQNIAEVCQFFGKDKTNDLILSHLITYLNDKNPYLRVCFIESILPISMFTGISSLEQYILPLLVQTINDPDELVVFKILRIFKQLISIGMLKKHYVWDLVKIVTKLVLHPNEWIRKTTLQLIITTCEVLSLADLYCILYPIIRPFFQYDVTVFSYDSLSPCLAKPLSRSVYNLLISWAQTTNSETSLFWQKQNNSNIDSFGNSGLSFMVKTKSNLRFNESVVINNNEVPVSPNDKLWLMKLQNCGLLESEFWKLATMRDYIYRISRLNFKNSTIDKIDANIEIQKIGVLPKTLFFDVVHKSDFKDHESIKLHSPPPPSIQIPSSQNNVSSSTLTKVPTPPFSPPQQLLFGKMTKAPPSIHEDRGNAFAVAKDNNNDSVSVITQHSANTINSESNKLVQDFDNGVKIVTKIQHNYKGKNPYILKFLSSFKFEPQLDDYVEFGPQINVENRRTQEPNLWKPKGVLVAHLVEHKSSCNCIAISPDHNYFVTGDSDGFLKIWDSLRLERNVTGNSSLSVNLNSTIKSITFLGNRDCFAVSLKNGFIKCFRIAFEKNGKNRFNKLVLIREYKLVDEVALQLEYLDDLLILTTSSSRIIGIDIKTMKDVFILQNDVSHGLPVSFVIDKNKKSWILVSTTNGVLDLWDIRFEIHLKSIVINAKVRLKNVPNELRKMTSKRNRSVMLIGEDDHEISIIDISKATSSKKQLGNSDEISKPLNQLEVIQVMKNSYLISSTSKNELVYWDLKNLTESNFLLNKDETVVFNEIQHNEVLKYSFNIVKSDSQKRKNKYASNFNLIDLINDIKFINKPYEMIIASDRSGCINVYR